MLLKEQSPGTWVNPAWRSGPGTFAVVIGVSEYDHLDGGGAPAKDTYDLGQLYVSALTAYRFFVWLQSDYHLPDRPLAKCWLLLAPTPGERRAVPGLPATSRPTFAACQCSIEQWFASMAALPTADAEQSRTVFFFSGHGLEVAADKQILLPCDYLRPPVENVNGAMSTYNLSVGLRALPLPEQIFFLDACRSDHARLRGMALQGTPILNERSSSWSRPDVVAPIIYATGPGAAAWQPQDPDQGPSLFGRAVLEGLRAVGLQPECDPQACWVTVFKLASFLSPRIRELLRAAGSRVLQPVRMGGAVADASLTEVPRSGLGLRPAGPAAPPAPAPPIPGGPELLQEVALPPGWRHPQHSGSESGLHAVLQSEFVTWMWWHLRVFDLVHRQWTSPPGAPDPGSYEIRRIRCSRDKLSYRVELQMKEPSAYWVELSDEQSVFASVLPNDWEWGALRSPRFLLELELHERGGRRTISELHISLAHENSGLLSQAAELWDRYSNADIIAASSKLQDISKLAMVVYQKRESPLAASVAALLLLRAWHREQDFSSWLANLAHWFPDRPDGIVLYAEQLLRSEYRDAPHRVIPLLLTLSECGLPWISEVLGHAARQAHELLSFAKIESLEEHQRLSRLQSRLERAMMLLQPGSCFAVFTGPPGEIIPELLLPGG